MIKRRTHRIEYTKITDIKTAGSTELNDSDFDAMEKSLGSGPDSTL
jgi:hypothetical protein